MKIEKLKIEKFKNLINFEIDFQETSLITVLIGKNGTGKSNLIEAIVSIFRNLYLPSIYKYRPPFAYYLKYKCNNDKDTVEINASFDRKGMYSISVNNNSVDISKFLAKDKNNVYKYLPRYLVAYYSGTSERLKELFKKHQEQFLDELLKNRPQPLRPMLYARLMHSHYVLLSFFLYPDKKALSILKNILGIEGIESVLFVLKPPIWNPGGNRKIPDGDKRFWYAGGVVKTFLAKIYEKSFAPIRIKIDKQENLHLYFPDVNVLKGIIQDTPIYQKQNEFFKVLESMDISDLVKEVRTVVKKVDVDGKITYRELSEGEQQFIMVLGLMKFTKDKESLYLLDEPDTHLNPAWKFTYLNTLKDIIGSDERTSQIIMSTHDPLSFFGLKKEQVIVFEKKSLKKQTKIETRHPEKDPDTMSVNAILMSDLFGLNSAMSPATSKEMQTRRDLFLKKSIEGKRLTAQEEKKLNTLTKKMGTIITESVVDDPIYNQFMEAMNEVNKIQFNKTVLTAEEIKERKDEAVKILKTLIEKKNKV